LSNASRMAKRSPRPSEAATYNILLMGASYGSLLASKLLFGGHNIHLICLPAEADLINAEGFRVRMPIRGRKDPVVIDSRTLPGKVTAGGVDSANPADFDLVGLAMAAFVAWGRFGPGSFAARRAAADAIRRQDAIKKTAAPSSAAYS